MWAVGLGVLFAGVLAVMVVRTEDATARPDGLELIGAVLWRGVLYGVTDGLLLSVFPILVVFAAFAGSRLDRHFTGKIVIGAVALIASLAMTAVYHAGYSDFRSDKVGKPLTGDVDVERPDPRHAQPARSADRTRRPARVRRPAQLRHGHVPATAQVTPPGWHGQSQPGRPKPSRTLRQIGSPSRARACAREGRWWAFGTGEPDQAPSP